MIITGIILAKPVTFAQKTEHIWALWLWCFITTLMFGTSSLLVFLFDEVFSFSTKKLLDQKVLAPIKGKAKGLPHQVTDHERHKLAAAASVDTLFGSVVVEQK